MALQQPSPPNFPQPDENGDYDSPPLKALRRVWKDYLAEQTDEAQVMDVIAEVGRFAQHNLGLLEKQIAAGTSNPKDPAFALILEAFELVLEGCESMALEFVEADPDDEIEEPEEGFFEFGLDLIQEATNQMMEGHQRTLDHIEAIGEASCPFCGQRNPREETRCAKCGRTLPQADLATTDPGFSAVQQEGIEDPSLAPSAEVTENCVVLARAVADWQAGQISHTELAQVIGSVEQKLLAHLDDTERQESLLEKAPSTVRALLTEAIGQTQDALEMSLAAIERMRLAFEKEDDTYLHLGLSDFEEASRRMVESFRVAEAAAGR